MALAYDTSSLILSGTDTRSWSHSGSASARGAIVVVAGGAVDSTSGVTYGGVAMQRMQTGVNAAGESGTVSVWFLGSSLPSGTQTVEVTRNTAVDAYIAAAYTVTAAADVEYVTGDNGNSINISNIACSLTIPNGNQVFMAGGLYSGENALSSITSNGDLTNTHTADFGNFTAVINRKTTLYTGTGAAYTNFAWTQSSDDAAWAAIAVKEGVAVTPKSDSDTLTPSVTDTEASILSSVSDSETVTPSVTDAETVTPIDPPNSATIKQTVTASQVDVTTENLTFTGVNTAVADTILLAVGSENDNYTLGTPSGGTGISWALKQSRISSQYTTIYLWEGTVTAVNSNVTITVPRTGATSVHNQGGVLWVTEGSSGTENSLVSFSASGVPDFNITSSLDDGIILFASGDWDAVDGSSRAFSAIDSSPYVEDHYIYQATRWTFYAGHWVTGTAGQKTVTQVTPDPQKFNAVAIVLKAPVTATVSDDDTVTVSVTETSEHTITEGAGGGNATYVAYTQEGESFSTTATVAKPAGTTVGDLVLVHIARWAGTAGMSSTDITPPAGAVLIGEFETTGVNNGGGVCTVIYGFVAGVETQYTFDFDTEYWRSVFAVTVQDVDTSNIAALADNYAASTTTNLASVAATAAAGDAAIWFVNLQDYSGGGTLSAPTNYTLGFDGQSHGFAYRNSLTAGTQTASGATYTEASGSVSALVIAKAAGSTTETRVFGDTDTASLIMTDGGEDIVTGGAPTEKTDSETLTVSVTESESIVTYSDVPGTDTLAISVTESESIVVQSEKFITSVSPNGRYFRDQNGDPILLRGVAPWGAFVNNTPAELEDFWIAMKAAGFNAAMVSLLPDQTNGADSNSGQTFDGIAPFTTFPTLNETYWERMDAHIDMAADYGFTLLIYPVDSWVAVSGTQVILSGASNTNLATYGTTLAQRWASKPNLIWMTGGDYYEPFDDAKMAAALDAVITELGASNILTSAMLVHPEWTMRQTSGTWSEGQGRADFNFLYVYDVSYDLTQKAYAQHAFPVLHGENKYLDEGATATIFRRNSIWALTAGACGDIPFNVDWAMGHNTWQDTFVNAPDANFFQAEQYHGWFAGLTGWYDLIPDVDDSFILTGRGTKINRTDFTEGDNQTARAGTNDYATATLKADGTMAVCYVPTQRAITLDLTELNSNPVAKWVHPTTLAETAIADPSVSITPPAAGDWLLYITADDPDTPVTDSETLTLSVTETEQIDVVLQVVTDSDTATVTVTDAEQSDGVLTDSDTATISASDAEALVIDTFLTNTDTATISVSESEEIFVALSDDDSATVSASDTSGSDGTVSDSDTATVSVTDDGVAEVAGNNPVDPDSAYITIAETESIDVGTPGDDTASIAVAEVESIFGVVTDSDTLTVSITEDGSFGQITPSDSDSATVSVTDTEQVTVVLDSKSEADSASLSITESETTLVAVSDTDTLQPTLVEGEVIGLTVADSDSVSITVTEAESAVSGAPWTVQFWNGTALLESGQFQYWDGTQLIGVTADEPLIWDGTQFVPLSSL